ncbi:MAG: peptidoglycan bridge formation glycyltransferase FemA/FemB family protein, partial [Bacilli bacterium]
MKLITLSEKEFNDFSKNHELTSFYQTSMYGNSCKNDFSTHYIGIVDDNKLIGASLILYKKIFMNFKYAYAPRGILIDYTNKALLKDFTIKFKH